MEEECWKQFMKTGNIVDYLIYKENFEREETRESDYSDGNGTASITYR